MRHLIALVISALCALSLVSCAKKMRHKSLECSPSMAAPPGRKPHFIARCAVTPNVGIKHIRFAFFSKHGVDRFKTSARSISETEFTAAEREELRRLMSMASYSVSESEFEPYPKSDVAFIVIDQSNFIRWVNIPLRKVDKFYGPEVARYCRERLPKILAAKPLIAGKDDSLTSMPKRPPLGPNGR